MPFEYLDDESEKMLKEILDYETLPSHTIRGYVIKNLIELNYVEGHNVTTLSDSGPCYMITGVSQKGKSYFELKSKYEKDKKKLSHREWVIAIAGAVIGALIGLIPTIIGWLN